MVYNENTQKIFTSISHGESGIKAERDEKDIFSFLKYIKHFEHRKYISIQIIQATDWRIKVWFFFKFAFFKCVFSPVHMNGQPCLCGFEKNKKGGLVM